MKNRANKFLHRNIQSYLSSSRFSWAVVSSLQIGCPHEGQYLSGSLNNMNLIEGLPPVYSPTISNKKIKVRMFLYPDWKDTTLSFLDYKGDHLGNSC